MKPTFKYLLVSLFTTTGYAVAGSASAEHPHQPPEEAFQACASKKSGDACTEKRRDGQEEPGTCSDHHEDGRLFCRPNRPHGPPPEAIKACEGKSVADACTVTFGDRSEAGKCETGPDGTIACRPQP